MNLIAFECSKCRDGYRIVTTRPRLITTRGARELPDMPVRTSLVAVSKRFDRYSPFEHFPALFASFADTPASAEGMRRFSDNFGLPCSSTDGNAIGEMLDQILMQQTAMRRALALFEKGDAPGLVRELRAGQRSSTRSSGQARLELRLDAQGKLATAIVPSSLIQAMWIQFMLHVASDAQLFRCEQCGNPFAVGTGTGRRKTAMYCSPACKVAAFKSRKEG
jgi:predicted RNA-binding Zn-ribbon protein involved in translation (DUF1610 family)